MTKEYAAWDREPESILFFSDIEPDPNNEYVILIKDINDYDIKTLPSKADYIIFKVKFIKGREWGNKDCLYTFHIPLTTFKNKIAGTKGFKRIGPDEKYDALLTFKRKSTRITQFLEIVYLPMHTYNEGLIGGQE